VYQLRAEIFSQILSICTGAGTGTDVTAFLVPVAVLFACGFLLSFFFSLLPYFSMFLIEP